jgi:hypothetical protein
VLVSSLCAAEGYCWATNEYIGEKLGLSKSQVSRSIKQLEKYISISNPFNERRTICLRKNAQAPTQKPQGSLRKNAQHNSIRDYHKLNKGNDSYKTPEQLGMPDLGGYEKDVR